MLEAPKDWRLPVLSLLNFAIIGVLAMHFPQLLGNGKGPAGLAFDGNITMTLAAMLLVLKVVITASSLRAGAEGGLLTPGLANGALLAIVLGGSWSLFWPGALLRRVCRGRRDGVSRCFDADADYSRGADV